MRTELPPLPSEWTPPDGGLVDVGDAIADLEKRIKHLEWVLSMMTVNNASRQVMWNGAVNNAGVNPYAAQNAKGGGGGGGCFSSTVRASGGVHKIPKPRICTSTTGG